MYLSSLIDENFANDSIPKDISLSSTLKFSTKKVEIIYQLYKRRQKRVLMMVILLMALLIMAFEAWRSASEKNFIHLFNVLVFGAIAIIIGANTLNLMSAKLIKLGNQFVYLLAVSSLTVSCTWKRDVHSFQVANMIYLSEAVFALPLIIGSFLDIDVLILLVCQPCMVFCQLLVMANYAKDEGVQMLYLEVQSIVGAMVSFLCVYMMLRNERMSFLQKQRLMCQERGKAASKLKNQQLIIEAKGRYIAQVAHDIGTPLATFTLAVELLQSHAQSNEMKDILETAQCAIELMTVTRREALDHAKHLEGVELCPAIKEVQLTEIIRRCARLIQHSSAQSKFKAEFYLDSFLPQVIFTDYDWIWTMLTNFLSNAQKYSNRGNIVTTMYESVEGSMLRVEVADEGIGVPPDRKHLLFKPFAQLMKSAGGTGLGLHGVSMKAKALGGSVGVRDNPASVTGSAFWFEIPCVSISDDANSCAFPLAEGILFVGSWPCSILGECDGFLKKRFMKVHHIQSSESYRREVLEKGGPHYSVVFWYLDRKLMDSSLESLVTVASSFKTQIDRQSLGHNSAFVYVTCAEAEDVGALPELPLEDSKRQIQRSSDVISKSITRKSWMLKQPSFQSIRIKVSKIMPTAPGSRSLDRSNQNAGHPTFNNLDASEKRELSSVSRHNDHRSVCLDIKDGDLEQRCGFRSDREVSRTNNGLQQSKVVKAVNETRIGLFLRHPVTSSDIKSLVLRTKHFCVSTGNGQTNDLQLNVGGLEDTRLSENLFRTIGSNDSLQKLDKKVLVVDDEPSILKFLSKMLNKNGFHVTTKINGFEAWMLMKEEEFGVVIIDLNMPVMDGLECIRRFREWEKHQLSLKNRSFIQPIIMLSANASRTHVDEALQTGADEFVAKPVKINTLIEAIYKVQNKELSRSFFIQEEPSRSNSHSIVHPEPPNSETHFEADFQATDSQNKIELAMIQPKKRKRILIVDDNLMLLKMSGRLLENRGYEVFTGTNGAEALNLMTDANSSFDAVIMDHQMPVMDGLECIRRFRRWEEAIDKAKGRKLNDSSSGEAATLSDKAANKSHKKIILLSGADVNLDKDLAGSAILTKIDGIFVKPVNYERLIELIEKEQV